MKRLVVVLAALVCVGAMSHAAWAAYAVGFTHGTNKHRPELNFAAADTLELQAAQNEWEPFQVLVRDDAGLTNVDVAVSEFTGPGDPITEIELYRVHYVPVTIDTISHNPPDPNNVGDWPDGLVPFVDHFVGETRNGAPFDVAPDFSQAVFVDVFIPANQAPGEYTATVTVTADGHAAWTGTVTLTVWDFAIPTGISAESSYLFSQSTAWSYHQGHGGVATYDEVWLRYMQEFARHRMGIANPINFHPSYAWNDVTWAFDWDWAAFDAYHGPLWDGTFDAPGYEFTSIMIPWAPGGCPGYVDPLDWENAWWKGWADHFRAKGWLEKLFLYLPDEPEPSEYPYLVELANRLHNADPDLRAMTTEQFEEEMAGAIDIWDPDEPLFSDSLPWPPYPEVYDERRALGETTWWYNCVSASFALDFATHFVDYESTAMRIWLWLTRRYGFTGILFWQTVYQYNYADPWTTQYIDNWMVQGDGTMIYPGTIDRIGGTTDIPVASLRMKYLREAMEDYEYFRILDDRGDNEWVSDLTRTVAPKTFHWEHDWAKVLDYRRMAAEKILGTLDEVPPGAPTALAASPAMRAIELSWTAPVTPDLAGYDIWYGIYEGDEFFGGTASASATSATLDGLMPDREHFIWIKAFDESGNRSASSAVVRATPLKEDGLEMPDGGGGDDDDEGDSGSDSSRNDVGVREPDADGADDDDSSSGCGGWR